MLATRDNTVLSDFRLILEITYDLDQTAAMREPEPVSIEKQLETLPPLPITVSNVLKVVDDSESSANDLVKAILPDQTMCVAILKTANSALYGRPKKVSSLEVAVTVLGFNEIQNIVLAKAALTAFKPLFEANKRELALFWDHAFTCGLAAKIISEHINVSSGQFFIAGLLHDIGKLAMFLAYGEKYDTSRWLTELSDVSTLEEEKQTFSITHDIVGSRLLKRWQFPDSLVAALRYHHSPHTASELQSYPLIIQLADFLSFMCIQPESNDEQALITALYHYIPDLEVHWKNQDLPWDEFSVESWFAWLKVDREYGSEILDILTS